LIFSE